MNGQTMDDLYVNGQAEKIWAKSIGATGGNGGAKQAIEASEEKPLGIKSQRLSKPMGK